MNARTALELRLRKNRTLRDLFPGLYRPAREPGGRAACMVSPRLLAKYPVETSAPAAVSAVLEALAREARTWRGATLEGKAPGLRFRLQMKHT